MTKPVSCGIIVLNEKDEILVGHSTGNDKYDLPKGQKEENERHIDCAIRECKEETGILFEEKDLSFIDRFNYSRYKDLVLYLADVRSEDIDMTTLICESHFVMKGKTYPEMDHYKWIPIKDYKDYLFKNMIKVFDELMEEWEIFIK